MADMKTFDLSDKALQIGNVFTPLKWGEFAIAKFDLFSNGSTGLQYLIRQWGKATYLKP